MSGPMNLVYPVSGDTTDTWGVVLNTLLGLVENHDHTSGKGSLIRSAALGINADVSWASYALTAAKAIAFVEQAPAAMTLYSSALFASSADHNLYWRNSSGTNVQITSGSTLNVSIVGGIGGDYAAVSAIEDFTDATHSYGLRQQVGLGVRQYAKLFTGDVSLYEFKVNGTAGVPVNAVTLKSPASLASPYSMTWPAALPSQAAPLTIDASGVVRDDGVFGTNQNLQLQGTGYIKRGNQTRTFPILPNWWLVAAGSVNNTGGATPGAAVAANTTAYYPVPLHAGERIQSVTTNTIAGLNAMTWSLVTGDLPFGAWTAVAGASNTNTGTNTLTPTTPFVPSSGQVIYLKIVTTTGTTTPISMSITTDVP